MLDMSCGMCRAVSATVVCVALAWGGICLGDTVYQTNFDGLGLGQTEDPARPDHDGWTRAPSTSPPAYGEIQDSIALSASNALHEYTDRTNPEHEQCRDFRLITPPNLALNPLITLSAAFRAHSSDYEADNPFTANLGVHGGPHPGFEMIAFRVYGGNDVPKSVTGVNVGLGAFNGVNGNYPIPLTVGQGLTWEEWHSVVLVIDQAADRYVSLTVNGFTQDLSSYRLPRSYDDSVGQWKRGQLMEIIIAEVVPMAGTDGVRTDDSIYWDDVSLVVVPEPATLAFWALAGLELLRRRRTA